MRTNKIGAMTKNWRQYFCNHISNLTFVLFIAVFPETETLKFNYIK